MTTLLKTVNNCQINIELLNSNSLNYLLKSLNLSNILHYPLPYCVVWSLYLPNFLKIKIYCKIAHKSSNYFHGYDCE
jgi:hypothetical protein